MVNRMFGFLPTHIRVYVQGCMTVSMNSIAMHIHMATQFEHDHYSDYEGQRQ